MSAEILRRAASRMQVDLIRSDRIVTHPAAMLAVAHLLDSLADELERDEHTVESDALPTWLHCEIENVAHAYLGGVA